MNVEHHRITLIETNGRWVAKDEQRGIEGRGDTDHEALQRLHEAVEENEHERTDMQSSDSWVDSDDAFFTAPTFSSDESELSTTVDETLYGPVDTDEMNE